MRAATTLRVLALLAHFLFDGAIDLANFFREFRGGIDDLFYFPLHDHLLVIELLEIFRRRQNRFSLGDEIVSPISIPDIYLVTTIPKSLNIFF